ncbi:MAG: hypothetical protein HYX92_12730 [Chloroflexi bacterium]|nr:hypothetical protein [Chloroflexota bacterium]
MNALLSKMNEYPSLASLLLPFIERLNTLPNCGECWLFGCLALLKRLPSTHELPKLFFDLDGEALKIPEDDSRVLRGKFGRIIGRKADCYKEDYDDALRDTLAEIVGRSYLSEKGYEDIKAISESQKTKTPDWQARSNGALVLMECKNVHNSKEEASALKSLHAGRLGCVKLPAARPDDFVVKIKDVVQRAVSQMDEYGRSMGAPSVKKVVFLNVSLSGQLIADGYPDRAQVQRELDQLELALAKQDTALVVVEKYGLRRLLVGNLT